MARGRKAGPTRLDLRRQGEAAEAREGEEVEKDDDEEKDEDDEDEDDEEAEADGEEAADPEAEPADDDDDEDAPKKKKKVVKKKKEPVAKKTPVKRTRAVKEVRMKAVWIVFDNGNKRIETFPYSQKADAELFLAAKIEEKKATFFLQLVKEALD